MGVRVFEENPDTPIYTPAITWIAMVWAGLHWTTKKPKPQYLLSFWLLSDCFGWLYGGDGQNRTADLWVMNPSL